MDCKWDSCSLVTLLITWIPFVRSLGAAAPLPGSVQHFSFNLRSKELKWRSNKVYQVRRLGELGKGQEQGQVRLCWGWAAWHRICPAQLCLCCWIKQTRAIICPERGRCGPAALPIALFPLRMRWSYPDCPSNTLKKPCLGTCLCGAQPVGSG